MTSIVTWNVNSVRARLEHLINWLEAKSPDIVLLQELKCENVSFPYESIESLGYNVAVWGQKTFNGVAILSKRPLEDIQQGLPGYEEDPQARYIEAVTGNMRVASVYVPNGQEIGCEKYHYKLIFLEHLYHRLKSIQRFDECTVIGGDFNIAPTDFDVYDPISWKGQILCSDAERQAFRKIIHLGYTDALAHSCPSGKEYTWWDYRKNSFNNNQGLRIDHLLLSPQAADLLDKATVDTKIRGLDKASDHAPVWCLLNAPF